MPSLETLSVKPLVDFHTKLSKLLKDNNIDSIDNSIYQQKIADVIQSLAKVQTSLVNSGIAGLGAPSLTKLLADTKTDIINTVGGFVSSDIERLLTLFTSSAESIESNFTSLRQRIDDLEHNLIEAIRQERD